MFYNDVVFNKKQPNPVANLQIIENAKQDYMDTKRERTKKVELNPGQDTRTQEERIWHGSGTSTWDVIIACDRA